LAFPLNLDVLFIVLVSIGHIPVHYICSSATPLQRLTSQFIRFRSYYFLLLLSVFTFVFIIYCCYSLFIFFLLFFIVVIVTLVRAFVVPLLIIRYKTMICEFLASIYDVSLFAFVTFCLGVVTSLLHLVTPEVLVTVLFSLVTGGRSGG